VENQVNQVKPSEVSPADTDVITVVEYNGEKRMYDDSDLIPRQAVLDIIRQEEELEGSPFDELPFWKALDVLLYMYLHPFENARFVVRNVKSSLYHKIKAYKAKD
jgi:hypothetical protein